MTTKVGPEYPKKGGKADIAFVGEAPSWEELEKGRPLVGPAGKIFNSMLRTAELRRDDYLITNVFDEKAPGNDVSSWMGKGKYEKSLERLGEEIAAVNPTVIVPLGGTAMWAFSEENNITSTRGAPSKATRVAPGKKLVPTFHPSYVMKQWKMYPIVVGDLKKARVEADLGPEIKYVKRSLYIEPTLKDLDRFKDKLLDTDLLSVDIETGWGQITNIGFAPSEEWALNIPFVDLRKPNKSYWGGVEKELKAWDFVKEVLESPVPKLGQNYGAYDAFWLLDLMGIRTMNLMEDPRLLHHALYPELPKDLQFMGASYAEQGIWKSWNKKTDKTDD